MTTCASNDRCRVGEIIRQRAAEEWDYSGAVLAWLREMAWREGVLEAQDPDWV